MQRRQFVIGMCALARRGRPEAGDRPVRLTVDTRGDFGSIPEDFLGLGYEISSVAVPGLLTVANRSYVDLVRGLGHSGVIRIGGNTSDDASFDANGHVVSKPKGTVVNEASLRELATFLTTTGWRLIWGLNLGKGKPGEVAAEALAVSSAVGDRLLAFEIGNEPDLFGRGTAHRPRTYAYVDYLAEFRKYKAAIRTRAPHAAFAGPDAASATGWVTQFARDEGRDLKLLTHHYYRECAGPDSTLDKLLDADPKLPGLLDALKAATKASGIPYRICETNSFCGGGKPGVSDTFGAALWALDFAWELASAGCAGVNFETGVNQLGFVSSYSPIVEGASGSFVARPLYYGMLAFALSVGGQMVRAEQADDSGVNLTSYAVRHEQRLVVTLINKDRAHGAAVSVAINKRSGRGRLWRLTAPSLDSKEGVTLAREGTIAPAAGFYSLRVPAGSAAILECEV